MAEKPTAQRVQDAIDEHRALLWQLHDKVTRHLRMIEGEIQKLDELASAVSPARPRRIVDKIVDYLEEKNHAATEEEIVAAMVKIGAAAGRRDSEKQIRDSINANVAPRHRTPRLKWVGKLVGLSGWGAEKFR